MPELSKTARASQVKEVREKFVESREEAIRQIRLNLQAGLYITNERIRKLLEAYDEAVAVTPAPAETSLIDAMPTLMKLMNDPGFLESIKTAGYTIDFEEINKLAKAFGLEPAVVTAEYEKLGATVVMKDPDFDHPEEDTSHHEINYGHNTVHPEAAGA